MSPMHLQPVTKREIVAAGPPEDFTDLVEALYGGVVDPDVVWDEVFKLSPDQADLNAEEQRKDKLARRATAGLSAVGAGAGALGLAVGAREIRRHGWKNTPKLTRALVPVEVLGLGGELAATHILHSDASKPDTKAARWEPEEVDKASVRVAGAARRVVTGAENVAPKVKVAGAAARRPTPPKPAPAPKPAWAHPAMKAPAAGASSAAPATPSIRSRIAGLFKPTQPTAATGPSPIPVTKPAPAPATTMPPVAGQAPVTDGQQAAFHLGGTLRSKPVQIGAGVAAGFAGANYLNGRSQPSPYYGGKRDDTMTFTGEFSKFDDSKRQAFGWASVVSKGGVPVVDRQGDYISAEDLEEAAYNYVRSSRVGGDMHRRGDDGGPHKVSDMIESIVFTDDKIAKMGLPEDYPRGWWVGFKIHDEPTWDLVRKQGRTGFSIHGRGIRNDVDLDSMMGYTQ